MRWSLFSIVAVLSLPAVALAESARFYDLEGFGSFLDGNPESTAVSEDGTIRLPLQVTDRFEDSTATYSAAAGLDSEVVVARVDDGRVLAVDRKGKTTELATFEDQLVTAMTVMGKDVYVATGPKAKIHRVRKGSKPKLVAELEATFIWDMVDAGGGDAFIATGVPGTVARVDLGDGKSETLFDPEQEHLRSLFYEKGMGLFVGGGERGILYRSMDLKSFRALFDSGHSEVTSIVARDGYAYVAGVSGAEALVKAQGEGETKGVEVRSQMVRVSMDGAAETLAGSNDEAIFDMGFDAQGRVLVTTGATGRDDPRGRIYSVDPKDRDIALLYQSPSRRITHLVDYRGGLAAVAAAGGRIVTLDDGLSKSGEFFTAPFDAGINAKIGSVRLYGAWPEGTRVTAAVRSGQTATPDETWSDWSAEVQAPGGNTEGVPNGRYMQVRVTLNGNGKETPSVHRIRVAYLRQNLPPFVREVSTLEKGVALLPITRPPQQSSTVNLDGRASGGNNTDKPKKPSSRARARKVNERGALTVRWVAEDPNGDDLRYDLRYRSLGHRAWTELGSGLEEPFYTLNSAQLPDGHYQFQVRASDAPSNPDGVFKDDTRESRAILIDNTPPTVEKTETKVSGNDAIVRIAVADNVGPIMAAEFAVDGREFRPLPPDDGVLDGNGETFTLRLEELDPGPHSVTVRVSDEADNEGYGQVTFQVR